VDARLPAMQNEAAPQAGWSAAQSASGASTFLRPQKRLPRFPREPRRKARPQAPLSMTRPRLGVAPLQSRPSLPQAVRSRPPFGATPDPAVPSLSRGACRERSRSRKVAHLRAHPSQRRAAESAVTADGSCIMRTTLSAGAAVSFAPLWTAACSGPSFECPGRPAAPRSPRPPQPPWPRNGGPSRVCPQTLPRQ